MPTRSSIALACLAVAVSPLAYAGPNPAKVTAFQFLGPAPAGPTASNMIVVGAVQAIAVAPGHKNVVWIGAVNGGVWRTDDFRPGEPDHAPTWKPLTDDMPSLSIGALSIDPTDGTSHTVVAALGDASSAPGMHGPFDGVLRTSDDGAHWKSLGSDLSGQDLTGVAARGATIVVTSKNKTNGGIWRSTDTGATFTRLSGAAGLPAGPATALVGDPAHADRLWAGIIGTDGGVFESDDTGKTWTRVSPAALDTFAASARKLALDAQSYAHGEHEVYVAVIDNKPPAGSTAPDIPAIYRLTQTGSGATSADEMKDAVLPDFETFDQGKVAIAADPLHDDEFFVTGDEGLEFRCTRPIGGHTAPTCTPISDKNGTPANTGHGTAPHADARMLVFDTDTTLVATDDGGVYVRSFPRMKKGDWFSKNGNLGINEAYWCAYDDHGDVALCGSQDDGVNGQPQPGATAWPQLANTDGGAVAVSDDLFPCPWKHSLNCSSRYFSRHKLADFAHLDCDQADTCKPDPGATGSMLMLHGATIACTNPSQSSTCGDSGLSERTPLAADRFDAQRIAIAGAKLYESTDGGATVSVVKHFTGTPTPAIVFGGEKSGAKNADLLFVGSSDGLFARTAAGPVALTAWDDGNGHVVAIALDHSDWSTVWVTTDKATVWKGTDVTGTHETWANVTGDLAAGSKDAPDLRAIAHVGGSDAYVVVGADDGLYAARTDALGTWWKLSGGFPNVVVGTISYSKLDDKLVIGTVGRSAWSIDNASKVFAPHLPVPVQKGADGPNVNRPEGPVHVNPGDPVEH